MGPAVEKLEAALATTDLKTPRIPVISNFDAEPHSDPLIIKKILAQEVVSLLHTKLL
jgi:[acyl-carrier-protein] S-malonyltransferase